ncbi:MAG: hypothetical protein AB8B47_10160 [Roseobacter sp.]
MNSAEIEDLLNMDIKMFELELVELYDPSQDDAITVTAWTGHDLTEKLKHVRKKLEASFETSKDVIKQKVCDDLDFCETVKNDKVNMVMWIVDTGVILGTAGVIPLPPVRATVYAMRLGMFDRLCGC